MNSIYLDLILSGITYVILTYLAFTLMKKTKKGGNEKGDGGVLDFEPPKIDLPPGIVWPDAPHIKNRAPEEVY